MKVPLPGQIIRFGEELLQINRGETYILAYLPDQYLFGIEGGMARPRDRSRLVRIAFDGPATFAVSQKVTISGCAFGICWAR